MQKKEVVEIKKQFTPESCALTRLCACYVSAEKERLILTRDAFLSLPEEDIFKYFELFRAILSGGIGKKLLNLSFPLAEEQESGAQERLYKLLDSRLREEEAVNSVLDRIIETLPYNENYLILLTHGAYDVPGKASDGTSMFDASDEVYEYILCAICPVNLSRAGLSFFADKGRFSARIRDWVVEAPITGFLFPAFNDRSTDLHSMLYYSKKPDDLIPEYVKNMFGCPVPMSSAEQKNVFNTIIEKTLGKDRSYEMLREVQDSVLTIVEDRGDSAENVKLGEKELRQVFEEAGAENTDIISEVFKDPKTAPELLASNVVDSKKCEIKTSHILIRVSTDMSAAVSTKVIDGKKCLVIPVEEAMEVNGIPLKEGESL